MDNILRINVDRSNRVVSTSNLSLNQCSNNNVIRLYYEDEYDYIEMSFRKPDGWLSDRVTLTFGVDEENYRYAYYEVHEELTSFIMGGKNSILTGNIYFHKDGKTSTAGNIRINVNYVDDALVHGGYSDIYMANLNSQIGALQDDFNDFRLGDILVGKAVSDRLGNDIVTHYETKGDAQTKFDTLEEKKLDKSEVQDQTQRLDILESSVSTSVNKIGTLEKDISDVISSNQTTLEELETLKETSISVEELAEETAARNEAINALQKQIDDISASSNVNDIVGTRAELDTYDTSKLEVGAKIQVLSDAFYENVPTVYRWTGSSWEYVGRYSAASYSKSEIDAQHIDIKKTIPDTLSASGNNISLRKGTTQIGSSVALKTINGASLLGAGDIKTQPMDSEFSITSENGVQNKVITQAFLNTASQTELSNVRNEISKKADKSELDKKQGKLTAGSNVQITEDGVISVSSSIKFSKVEVLPAVGDSNVIYLVPKEGSSSFNEFIWVDGRFELLGDSEVSLYDYYTKLEVDNLLLDKAAASQITQLDGRISANTVSLASKADKATTDSAISNLTGSINLINTSLDRKIESSALEPYALKTQIPDISTKQDKLVSSQNIKTINGVSLLGPGDLLIADTEITDLGKYVLKTENEQALSLKADKTELFDLDYNKLKNLPRLDTYAPLSSLEEVTNLVQDQIMLKQDELVSGSNIKTINGQSILGSGNLKVISDLTGYATEEYVQNAIKDLDVDVNLTGYATENWVQNWVGEQKYLNQEQGSKIFAVKSDIPSIPTNISAFSNDKGYLVASDIAHLETKETAAIRLQESKDYTDQKMRDIIGSAPEAYDTLKEIADYISSDKTGSASMLATINQNKNDIANLSGSFTGHTIEFGEFKTSTNATINQNKTSLSSLTTLVNNHLNEASGKFLNIEGNISTLSSDVEGIKDQLESGSLTQVQTNKENIATNTSEINQLKLNLGNYYTKVEADNTFLDYEDTISKATALVDSKDSSKQIKFTTSETNTEFEISTFDSQGILNLLSMIVPNEY